jgi:anti-sigma-K factor RskA/sigma-70-like protein
MATFDQLPAEQRAILELVIQRRQSYGDLADMLGMPTARVRQLAREALVDLSSRSAARVDDDWRGQVADYLLGQQTGPEATATRGHLKRSEAARLWALSLLDSLDHLYDESDVPVIPEGEAAPVRSRERARDRVREPEPPPERERRPRRERSSPLGGLGGLGGRTERPARPLSADAETIVRRRRIAGAAAAATALLFILLIWPVGLLTGDDDGGDGGDSGNASANAQPQVLGQLLLRPQSGEKGVGIALITEQDGERSLLVQARGLKPTKEGEAYEVWLFNSQQDATSMGAQLTDRQGNYQGAGRLPENYQDFQYLDISRETVDQNAAHSGDSVLRGKLSDIQAATGTDTTGTATTPTDTTGGGGPLGN